MQRRFKLINANGQEYDLNNVREKGFLHSVKNLGYEDDVDYQRIGDMFRRLRDQKAQMTITGTVRFSYDKGQHKFQDFVNFCQIKPLKLVYLPWDTDFEYLRDGTVTKVDYQESNTLSANIEFTCSTLPYRLFDVTVVPDDGQQEGGKIYDYEYNYKYRETIANNAELYIDTAITSPCKITMAGELINPTWRHYVNGKLVSTGRLNYTIPEGYKLVINTMTVPYMIQEVDANNNVVADLYEQSDFSTERFSFLQYGKNRISISDDSNNKVELQVQGMIQYAAV